MNIKRRRLPAEYQEVEWLKCVLGFIDTGFQVTTTLKIEVDGYTLGSTSLFGVRNYLNVTGSGGVYRFDYGSVGSTYSECLIGTRNIYGFDCEYATLNGDRFHDYGTAVGVNENIYLNGRNNRDGTGLEDYGTSVLYSCKIWDNNILVRNFIPCYRISDSEPGMYDLVNGVFYTNQGTGSFTVGDDVVTVDAITIPEGSVTRVTDAAGNVLWKQPLKFNQILNKTALADSKDSDLLIFSGTMYNSNIVFSKGKYMVIWDVVGTGTSGHQLSLINSDGSSIAQALYTYTTTSTSGSLLLNTNNNFCIGLSFGGTPSTSQYRMWFSNTSSSMTKTDLQLIDLTAMYGAGNEPTDVATVKADCKSIGHDLDVYQPYTPIA